MSVSINNMGMVEITIRIFLCITVMLALWALRKKSRLFLFVAIFFSFLPIIKVSLNSPHYSDLITIPFALVIGFGFDCFAKRLKKSYFYCFSGVTLLFIVSAAIFMAHRYVSNKDMWLALSQGWARSAMSDFSSAEGSEIASQVVGTSGMYYPASNWALSHDRGRFRSSLYVNLGVDKKRLIDHSDNLMNQTNTLFIDFLPNVPKRKVGAPIYGFGKMITAYFPSAFARIPLDITNNKISIGTSKVVRITCDNAFLQPFNVVFNDAEGIQRL